MEKKTAFISLGVFVILIIVLLSVGYIFGNIPATTSNLSNNTQTNIPTIPTNTNTQAEPSTSIIFDFDRGSPGVFEGQNTPFSQTSGGVTASFSSASDPAAFSIQSYKSTFYTLPEFSGKYLFDNKITKDIFYIAFSQPITKINFSFATIELHGPGHVEEPSTIKMTTYKDSIFTTSLGIAYANGEFTSSSFPQGTMSYDSKGNSFNIIQIELLYQIHGGTDFLIDNIVITTA